MDLGEASQLVTDSRIFAAKLRPRGPDSSSLVKKAPGTAFRNEAVRIIIPPRPSFGPASLNFNCPLFRNACRNFGEITRNPAAIIRTPEAVSEPVSGPFAWRISWMMLTGIIRGSCCAGHIFHGGIIIKIFVHGDCREITGECNVVGGFLIF